MSMAELNLEIKGMTCDSCADHVARALQGVKGVKRVEVPDWKIERAMVKVDEGIDTKALIKAVENAGYNATLIPPEEQPNPSNPEIVLDIRGMTCDSCAAHVEKALASVRGVTDVNVPDWKAGQATVIAESNINADELVRSVEQAGYEAAFSRMGLRNGDEVQDGKSEVVKGGSGIHLMVIGGGSAGFAAAIKGAELGYQVTLVEAGTIGGTCVNIGCVPSKALIRAMEFHHLSGEKRFRGVYSQRGELNWKDVIGHKNELVDELRQAKYVEVLSNYPSVDYIEGHARFIGGNQVEIDSEISSPDRIVIATGAQPWAPPIPGLEEAGYLTSTTAMELEDLPESMIVLGANSVGLEQAQIFSRAGVDVTVVEMLPRIAPFEDEDISRALEGHLTDEGIKILTGFSTQQVDRGEGRTVLTGLVNGNQTLIEAGELLVATGRRPNTAGLGLENAGVELGKRGEILVDESMQTSNPIVYAAGDVTGKDMFVYMAAYGAGLAAENALLGSQKVYDGSDIPRVTFTDPQIGSAGLTEAQAKENGYQVKVSLVPMEYVPRALAARDTRGMVKLVADAATDRLLGAHVLAPEGGEMIMPAAMALKLDLSVEQLRQMIFPYLTNVEAIKLAALGFEKDVAMLSCCAG